MDDEWRVSRICRQPAGWLPRRENDRFNRNVRLIRINAARQKKSPVDIVPQPGQPEMPCVERRAIKASWLPVWI
jgi:hypothetical protein